MNELGRLVDFFESLTPETVLRIGDFYAEDAYFRDPFNEVRGLPGIRHVFEHMFEQVREPRFRVTERLQGETGAFLTWDFTYRSSPGAAVTKVRGSTHLKFDARGKVSYHCDYWDAAGELYEKIPVLGALMRFLRRRLTAAR